MEEIFRINVNNETLEIRALDLSPEDTQYEVWHNGKLELTLEYAINKDNPGWKEVGKDTSGSLIQPFIEKVGEQIDFYYA